MSRPHSSWIKLLAEKFIDGAAMHSCVQVSWYDWPDIVAVANITDSKARAGAVMNSNFCWFVLGIFSIVLAFGCGREASQDAHSTGDHHSHGQPKDWKFTLAGGDAHEGKKLFGELQCYKCHEIKGEKFPDVASEDKGIGPELSQMAGMHTVEFFAESIANPNAVIDPDAKKQGHVGDDGKSKMPSFADVLTVKQLSDLATYLASLKSSEAGHNHKH